MTKLIVQSIILSVLLVGAINCLSEIESFHDDELDKSLLDPMLKPLLDAKPELFRYSRSPSSKAQVNEHANNELNYVNNQQHENNQHQQQIANEMPVFSQAPKRGPAASWRAAHSSTSKSSAQNSVPLSPISSSVSSSSSSQHSSENDANTQNDYATQSSPNNFPSVQTTHLESPHPKTHSPQPIVHTNTYYTRTNPNSPYLTRTTTTTKTTKFINGVQVDNNNQPIVQQQTTTVNQQPVQVAHLKEVRVHTFPLTQTARYVVVPSASANLEDSSSSSSSSSSSKSSSSSSSSTTTKEESVMVAPPAQTTTTTVVEASSAPVLAPAPDCTPVLQRIIMARPEESPLIIKLPSSSSSSHSSRLVSETTQVIAQPQPPVYRVIETSRQVVPVVHTRSSRIISVPAVVTSAPQSKEEHFHSESRSLKESSDGLGGFSSSSSSSSSRSSKSSSSSSSTTTTVHEATPVIHSATLLAAPAPVITKTITTLVREPAPVVTVKAAPLIAYTQPSGQTSTQVNVDHHYSSPNVNYGYSIKQSSVEPQPTKGVVVGERVVYLK